MAEHDENEVCESCERPLKDSRDFKKVKADLAAAVTRGDDLATKLLERTIKDAGFDPSLGIVKRLAATYDGELDAEAFKTYAEAEGLTSTPVEQTTEQPGPGEILAQQQAAGDRLRELSSSPTPEPELAARIRAAEESGDVNASMALKAQLLRSRVA